MAMNIEYAMKNGHDSAESGVSKENLHLKEF